MPEKSNGALVTIMVIIGIIIIILLLRPRYYGMMMGPYSYHGSLFTASSIPQDYDTSRTYMMPSTDMMRTYGHPITVYTDPETRTYTTYDTYVAPDQTATYNAYYPDGCTAYTTYSATTGYPCR